MMNDTIEFVEKEPDEGFRLALAHVRAARQLWRHPSPFTLLNGAVAAAAYAAFERIGTRANADTVEFTTNFGGGFLAIGMTDDQSGFIVPSILDPEQVVVSAEQVRGVAPGTHTLVEVRTPRQRWSAWLRDPEVIMAGEQGTVAVHRVEWRRGFCPHTARRGLFPRMGDGKTPMWCSFRRHPQFGFDWSTDARAE